MTASSDSRDRSVGILAGLTELMLVWGSRYRWTLTSSLLYLGFVGWTISGVGT